ncbi:hypothetical protein [Paenibacillus pini]|uniref:Uncharacterized protein n=1 Tax=Paenibacillus pini JCM 16418 TaxID=1236976 RepID=W7YJP2_9BACL|nr:hypothetical protein [Paenibacillus pini]GAF07903.1 hypothetical protein JCM16418_1936 [Paenibacillus pini JCM 16418]
MNGLNTQSKRDSLLEEAVYPLRLIRSQTVSLLILPNLLLLVMAFADPYVELWAWMLLVPLVIMDIMGVIIILFPARMQIFHLLFLGALGVLASSAFLAAANKLAYATLGVTSDWFMIATVLGYIVVFVCLYMIHRTLQRIGKYHQSDVDLNMGTEEPEPTKLKKARSYILVGSGAGILLGSVLIKWVGGYSIKVVLIIVFLLLLSLCYMLITSNLSKYMELKRNMHNVK